jgi:hypothetical protein
MFFLTRNAGPCNHPCQILDRDATDSPQFKALLEKAAENSKVKEVPADKAYLSRENLSLSTTSVRGLYLFKVNSVQGEAGTVREKVLTILG